MSEFTRTRYVLRALATDTTPTANKIRSLLLREEGDADETAEATHLYLTRRIGLGGVETRPADYVYADYVAWMLSHHPDVVPLGPHVFNRQVENTGHGRKYRNNRLHFTKLKFNESEAPL